MTDSGERDHPHDAADAVRTRAAAIGLDLSSPDLVAVTGFLEALAPGLAALAEVGRQLADDPDEHGASPAFRVEWQ